MEGQRKEALLYLEEILDDEDQDENDIRAELAWLNDLTDLFNEIVYLSKSDSAFRQLVFSTLFFSFHIRVGFTPKLRRKLRKCEGEEQELFENMLNKIEELRETAQEEVNALDNVLYGDDTMGMDITANSESETESIIEKSVNDAKKVDVYKLSVQKIQNLKDEGGLDVSNENKAVGYEENEQLDDLKAATADVKSFDNPPVFILEPEKDLNAIFVNKKEVEHHCDGKLDDSSDDFEDEESDEESFPVIVANILENKKETWSDGFMKPEGDSISYEVEELLSEDKVNDDHDTTGNDYAIHVNVHAKSLHASDRKLLENVARESKEEVRGDDNKDEIITVDVEEAISEKSRMFSEVEIKGVGLVPQAEISEETQKNRYKFPDVIVATKEVFQLELYEYSQEKRVVNLDIIKKTLETGKDNKASKDEMDGCDGDTVIDEKIKSVKEEIDELEDMNGDLDETCEVTEEDEHDKSTDKNSVEAFGEKHNNADSVILETTIMEDRPDVIQVQFKGTFLENSKEIHTNLKKFFEVEVKEVASNDAYVHSTLEDLDNEKVILIEEVKGDREV